VLFTSGGSGGVELLRRIEATLATTFGYRASVLLRSRRAMQDIVEHAPGGEVLGGDE
jgi:uncharacterized protein (DUF1697 family)